MARLQVLYLPSVVDGDAIDPRLALVCDQAADVSESDRDALRAFASELGAQGCLVVSVVLDLDQGEDDEQGEEALGELLAEVLRVPDMPQPGQRQAPKLPPPNTTEGKLARVLGGQKILDEMRGNDPQ